MKMREILFRGKWTDNREWIYGDLDHTPNGGTTEYGIKPFADITYLVIPKTVGQFTGLTDNSGIKIFDGDIRKDDKGRMFRIYNVEGGFVIKAHYWKSDIKDLVPSDALIWDALSDPQCAAYIKESTYAFTNIHDNPELLNQ
jgi:hypothetical protein